MPDHAHLIVRFPPHTEFVRAVSPWKHGMARYLGVEWQRDFFDHRLRGEESLEEKVQYVLNNPVWAGSVPDPAQWPHLWRAEGPIFWQGWHSPAVPLLLPSLRLRVSARSIPRSHGPRRISVPTLEKLVGMTLRRRPTLLRKDAPWGKESYERRRSAIPATQYKKYSTKKDIFLNERSKETASPFLYVEERSEETRFASFLTYCHNAAI